MANESIELLKEWNPNKMQWPALASEKLDGVPARLSRKLLPQTRQNTDIVSINHIDKFFKEHFAFAPGVELIGELYIRGKPFKDISGMARQHEQAPDLVLHVFDMFPNYPEDTARLATFDKRIDIARIALEDIAGKLGSAPEDLPIRIIPMVKVEDEEAALQAHDLIMTANPNAEGTVIASCSKVFAPSKRFWTTQKLKPKPTLDLEVIGFQEAVSEDGKPLGMVGRIVCQLCSAGQDGKITYAQIGVGPGKLTHNERKALWLDYKIGKWVRAIAEVQYMRDDSYEALRQPTFQRWREDKLEADVVGSYSKEA